MTRARRRRREACAMAVLGVSRHNDVVSRTGRHRSSFAAGSILAALAAISFGVTAPLISRLGHGVGSFTTAALLYAGALISSLVGRVFGKAQGPSLGRRDLPRVALVALCGAVVAPVLLAWGLARAGGMTGSLLLNLEAVFTVLLARAFFREEVGARLGLALSLMVAGGAVLAVGTATGTGVTVTGALAIAGATLFWSLDNTLSRKLAELDPLEVVGAKALLGVVVTSTMSRVLGEPVPGLGASACLLLCGATGYGLSLRLYLLAQRRFGAARTGSVFSLAPFVGAMTAWILGDRGAGTWTIGALVLFAAGVYFHATERHVHRHAHGRVAHDHAHRHDDGHHSHVHEPAFSGEHSHLHVHEPVEHAHEHGVDLHHDHAHS